MVKVNFEKHKDEIILKIEGHSGMAATGSDIVCASCSILAYTVAEIVMCEKNEGSLKGEPIIILENGKAYISCRPKDSKYEELLHTYYVAETGFSLLSHNYPQYVEVVGFHDNSKK